MRCGCRASSSSKRLKRSLPWSLAHAIEIVGQRRLRGITHGADGNGAHAVTGGFGQDHKAFHFHGIRLIGKRQLFRGVHDEPLGGQETVHPTRAGVACRGHQFVIASHG